MDKEKKLREDITGTLAAERVSAGISQEELASRLGTRKSNISRMESGRQNISIDYMQAIAEALDLQVGFTIRERSNLFGDIDNYSLRLYDEELVRFQLTRGLELACDILWINEERTPVFPPDLELTPEGMIRWLSNRIIPQNRELVGTILSALGLNINDIKGIVDICKGLSLNDSYWITHEDFDGSFHEYNLYENEFSEALSLIAYTGGPYDTREFRTSPELTTGGMLRKAWRFMGENGIWLYKSGTDGFANAGNEPYCEFYAAQVAAAMGLPHVEYTLENWQHILASKCKLFTDIDTAFVPAGRIVKSGGIQACLDFYKSLGETYYQELLSMIVFDAVILNEDRHFGNFGLLRDNHTGAYLRPAPIFDNGLSLLCYGMKRDFEQIETYIAGRTNPYGRGNDYMSLCAKILGPVQKKQLRKLLRFRFQENDGSNLPSWRLQALETMIRDRAKILLAV